MHTICCWQLVRPSAGWRTDKRSSIRVPGDRKIASVTVAGQRWNDLDESRRADSRAETGRFDRVARKTDDEESHASESFYVDRADGGRVHRRRSVQEYAGGRAGLPR